MCYKLVFFVEIEKLIIYFVRSKKIESFLESFSIVVEWNTEMNEGTTEK